MPPQCRQECAETRGDGRAAPRLADQVVCDLLGFVAFAGTDECGPQERGHERLSTGQLHGGTVVRQCFSASIALLSVATQVQVRENMLRVQMDGLTSTRDCLVQPARECVWQA